MVRTAVDRISDADELLRVDGLAIDYNHGRRLRGGSAVRAVDGISFHVSAGETLGLVGESGCGKSTTGRAILSLLEPTDGRILFEGEDTDGKKGAALLALRRGIQAVFQDPYDSLNPRMNIGDIIGEPLIIHFKLPRSTRRARVEELLQLVGLNPEVAGRKPSELSGGQRQRVSIAKALATDPKFIVCDEAVSALDVSVQAQVLNLLRTLQNELKLSYLFIGHDLSVVRYICNRIAVMYAGRLVESADCDELYDHPYHPYTRSLLESSPQPDPGVERARLEAEVDQDPINTETVTQGCRFSPRCPLVTDRCRTVDPDYTEVEPGRWVACHFWETVRDTPGDSLLSHTEDALHESV